ncbi:MAG: hypothetical protein WBM99_04385, partial [Psychromonas sp.]
MHNVGCAPRTAYEPSSSCFYTVIPAVFWRESHIVQLPTPPLLVRIVGLVYERASSASPFFSPHMRFAHPLFICIKNGNQKKRTKVHAPKD